MDGAIQLTESMGPRRKSTEPNIELELLAFVGFIREVVIYYDQIYGDIFAHGCLVHIYSASVLLKKSPIVYEPKL